MWLRMENPFFTLQLHLFLLLSFPRGATDFITGEKKTLWHLLHPHFSFFSSSFFFFSVFPSSTFFKNTTTIAAAAWSVDSTHTSSRSSRFNPHYSSSSSPDLSPSLLRRTFPALPLRFPFLRSFLREDETLKSNKPIISSTLCVFYVTKCTHVVGGGGQPNSMEMGSRWNPKKQQPNNNFLFFLLFLITTKCIHVCWWRSTNLDGNWGKMKP